MTERAYDIGIIGGGAAGLTIASGAAQLGARTLLVEREDRLGGDCLHYGCVPSKTLIKSAKVYHQIRNAERWGLPPVTPPPVNMGSVTERIRSVIDTIQKHDSEDRFCSLGAKVVFGDARFLDTHTVDYGQGPVSAKRWVIATGSSPAAPPVPGLEGTPYWTNKDIFSLHELPASLIVLGGGPIACEMAQSFARLGCHVTIIQRSPQILSKEDPDMAAVVQQSMEADGVRFELGSSLKAVRHGDDRFEVDYTQGEDHFTLHADKLLVALGRKPNIETLDLDEAGVEYTGKGVVVDARLRTSQKHIFAAGDVTGQYLFTHAAGYEGGIVISNAVFHIPRKADYRWMPHCTYTGPELASIGMNEKAAREAGEDYSVWTEEFADNDRALAEGESEGRIKLVLDSSERPLGVQICGPHAGDLIGEWVAALNAKAKLSTMASAVHPYPTLAEIGKRVAGGVLAEKLFSDKVRKTLHFIFDYKGRACSLDNHEEKA
ncbi:dihydrolipoyl dehydrogenase family protein [Salidesulfovibrio brasiliensis]|uniref:dihydrolipoyl dehydrogenase family protein n=1 Tax=Salidesulfovibrio brasiliensis TaxID=221711 RepID=UPI0006D020B3|nr:FAD-dependent oxidoreductase [Salidesulfovibrio brasiliensis]